MATNISKFVEHMFFLSRVKGMRWLYSLRDDLKNVLLGAAVILSGRYFGEEENNSNLILQSYEKAKAVHNQNNARSLYISLTAGFYRELLGNLPMNESKYEA